jgi:hypothetical protein
MTETIHWNGEPCTGRRLEVIVPEWREGDPPHAWWKPYQGDTRKAVLVEYYDQRHLLDDEDGSGWFKVTEGHGSPRWGHRDLPLRSVEVIV